MLLLKVFWTFWKKLCHILQVGIRDGQKVQLDIEKDGGRMMLVIVLVRNVKFGRSENRNTSKEKYLEAKKKARGLFIRANIKQKGEDL